MLKPLEVKYGEPMVVVTSKKDNQNKVIYALKNPKNSHIVNLTKKEAEK